MYSEFSSGQSLSYNFLIIIFFDFVYVLFAIYEKSEVYKLKGNYDQIFINIYMAGFEAISTMSYMT